MATPVRADARYLPAEVSQRGPFRLYRFWGVRYRPGLWWRLLNWLTFGLFATDVLLYIGQTGRVPIHRLGEHLATKSWAGDVRAWEVDDREYDTEEQILAVESRAIRAEWPVHNVVHNNGGVGRPNVRGPRRRARRRAANRLGWLAAVWLLLVVALWVASSSHWGGSQCVKAATVVLVVAFILRVPGRWRRRFRR